MNDFILLKDALNGKLLIVRKSMICSIEEGVRNNKSVRVLHYVDGRAEDYIENTLLNIFNALKEV